MSLPIDVENELKILTNNKQNLKESYEELSNRYRTLSFNKQVQNTNQAISYAMGRMPATHEVCKKVLEEIKDFNFSSISDYGSGTGACALAIDSIFNNQKISCFEYSNDMLNIGKALLKSRHNISWNKFNILTDDLQNADLITCSYVLNEVESKLEIVVKKLLNSFNKALVIIEAGTPHGFNIINKIRKIAIAQNFYIFAPCNSNKPCPIKNNDWCAFTARVNRNNFLQQIKQGKLSYEDENYSYLIITKQNSKFEYSRVLRHPEILKGHINLKVCKNGEIENITITKSMNEKYKIAKKINSGDKF